MSSNLLKKLCDLSLLLALINIKTSSDGDLLKNLINEIILKSNDYLFVLGGDNI